MDDGKKGAGAPPVAGVVLTVVALVMGMLWRESPLVSSRPALETSATRAQGDRVPARLWQDPFDAIADYPAYPGDVSSVDERSSDQPEVETAVARRVSRDTNAVVLVVTVSGGSLPDDIESRRRTRYAVVSALGASGYSPDDNSAIRVAPIDDARTLMVPFETYHRDTDTDETLPARAVVVWVKGDGTSPWSALREIVRWVAGPDPGADVLSRVRVIGPRTSDALQRLVRDPQGVRLPGLGFFSPWATAYAGELDKYGSTEDSIVQAFQKYEINFQRTIADDHAVATALVDELRHRGIDLYAGDGTEVAIVTERDTFYGRAFPRTFAHAAWASCRKKRPDPDHTCGPEPHPGDLAPAPHLHVYTYLKGLDGSMPQKRTAQSDASGDRKKASQQLAPTRDELQRRLAALERPEGDGQLDYLRRLADRIEESGSADDCGVFARLRQGCPRIGAIGVLGSDVYDKLLVLQALRPRFPNAVFFTTDLDALLMHPAETPWTRNLVVASGYGLTLPDDQQKGVPPFRDTYQTATFVATVRALRQQVEKPVDGVQLVAQRQPGGPPAPPENTKAPKPCAARLFEIGRYGAVDLSDQCDGQPSRRDVAGIASVWPRAPIGELLAGLVVIGGVLFAQALPFLGFSSDRTGRKALMLLAALVGIPIAFMLLAFFGGPEGEPFTLIEGVSIWPTEIVRTWNFVLCVLLAVRLHAALRASNAKIANKMNWPATPPEATREWLLRAWRNLRAGVSDPAMQITRWGTADGARDAEELWIQYMERARPAARNLRVAISLVLFLAIGFTLVALFGPPFVPYRGHTSQVADQVALWASVLAVCYLNFLVVDSTRLCVGFVAQLKKLKTPWSLQQLERAAGRWGVEKFEACELLRMRLIEKRTAVVGPLVMYPAMVVVMMVLARSGFFDAWSIPPVLFAIFVLFGIYVLGCAVILRRSARSARAASLARLRDRAWKLRGTPQAAQQQTKLETAIERIEAMSTGAFAPLAEHPIVRAVLVPSGSYGLLSLLETWYAFK
jgi:hypothetical protein